MKRKMSPAHSDGLGVQGHQREKKIQMILFWFLTFSDWCVLCYEHERFLFIPRWVDDRIIFQA